MNISGPVEKTSGVNKISKEITDLIYKQDKKSSSANKDYIDNIFNMEEIDRAVSKCNRAFKMEDNKFTFEIHKRTGRMLVKLIDNRTDEVIREIPPEKMLDIVGNIWDIVGILVNERG